MDTPPDATAPTALSPSALPRRTSGHALRSALEELMGFFGIAPVPLGIADDGGRFLRLNPAWERVLGYQISDLKGTSVADIAHPDDRQRTLGMLATLQEGDVVEGFVNRSVAADGSIRILEWSAQPSDHQFFLAAHDITDRVRDAEAIRASDTNFRALFDGSMDYLAVLDAGGRVVLVNHRLRERLGYRHEDLLGRPAVELRPPEVRDEAVLRMAEMLGGRAESCRLPLMAADGQRVAVETRVRPILWNGAPAFISASRDISELAVSEEKFAKAFQGNPSLMAVSTLDDGRFAEVNDTFLQVLGYAREEVLGRTVTDLDLFADPAAQQRVADEVARKGSAHRVALQVRTRDGKLRDGEFSAQVIRINDRPHFLTTMADVTERKRVERALMRRLAFEDLMVQSTAILYRADDGDMDALLQDVLARIGRFLHLERALFARIDAQQQNLDCAHEWCADGIAPLAAALRRIPLSSFPKLSRAMQQNEEIHIPDIGALGSGPEAERVALAGVNLESVMLMPVRAGRHLFGVLVFGSARPRSDLGTDARSMLRFLADNLALTFLRLEQHQELRLASREAGRLADEAAQASRAKSEFLANMSHEIRTPMNGVVGMTRLLLDTTMDDRQRRYGEILKASAESLMGVINDVLDFSKIEAGRMDIERISFSLEDVVGRVVEAYSLRAREKDVELLCSVDPTAPVEIVGDPLRLGQILNNLVGNALKFTAGGHVILSVRVLRRDDEAVVLEFSVRDSGIGMDDEQLSRLFRPFGQADSSTTRKFGGTGLGLAICRNLCHLMGGTISAQSRLGKGSTFLVCMPFGTAETSASRQVPDRLPAGVRLLLVNGSEAARMALTTQLGGWGIEVTAVATGEAALQTLSEAEVRGTAPALCLVDRRLPGIDGLETSRRIAAAPLASHPGIVLLTSQEEQDLAAQASAAGVGRLLGKPFRPSQLFETLVAELSTDLRAARRISRFRPRTVMHRYEGARVLAVEDNDINRIIALELLENVCIRADVAVSGREAVERVRQYPYDLVLMDIQMPDMDGLAATRAIRRIPGRGPEQLPIIAMTAHAVIGDKEKSLAAGMNDHLTKPIEPDDLYQALARWLPVERRAPVEAPRADGDPVASPAVEPALMYPVPGLDTAAGLARLHGNIPLYRDLLRNFLAEESATRDKLIEELRNGRTADAVRRVHSIRSVAGNLGALALQAAATALESTLSRSTGDVPFSVGEPLRTFIDRLEWLLAALGPALPPATRVVPAEPGSPDQLPVLLDRLADALSRGDAVAAREVVTVVACQRWPGWADEAQAQLVEYVRKYRYREALEAVEAARAVAARAAKGGTP